jgi:hypothetical protein
LLRYSALLQTVSVAHKLAGPLRNATPHSRRRNCRVVRLHPRCWRHAFGDTKPDADLTFIDGGASFSTQGVPIAKDSAIVEAGVDFQISPTGKLGIGYSGQLSNDNNDHAMTVSFSLGF